MIEDKNRGSDEEEEMFGMSFRLRRNYEHADVL